VADLRKIERVAAKAGHMAERARNSTIAHHRVTWCRASVRLVQKSQSFSVLRMPDCGLQAPRISEPAGVVSRSFARLSGAGSGIGVTTRSLALHEFPQCSSCAEKP